MTRIDLRWLRICRVAVEVMGVEACLVILAALSSSGAEEAT